MTMMRLAALAIAVGQAAACFSPSFGDGQFTCEISNDCPPGIACIDGVCGGAAIPAIDAGQQGADGPIADPPDAGGPPPDAGPPAPARVYIHNFGDNYWDSLPAEEFFSGNNAPDYTALETAWAMCRGTNDQWCVGTASAASCTADYGDSWGSTDWGSLLGELGVTPPTFVSTWDYLNADDLFKHVVFQSGALWWELEYPSKPTLSLGFLFWALYPVADYDDPGHTDRDTEWALDPNAPPSAAAVTADFIEGDDWILWTADGTQYRYTSEWEDPEPSEYLGYTGAPPAASVAAAFMCDDVLFVFTRGD